MDNSEYKAYVKKALEKKEIKNASSDYTTMYTDINYNKNIIKVQYGEIKFETNSINKKTVFIGTEPNK